MDIKPINVQMFINKSSSTSRLENNEQRNLEQSMIFSEQMKKNIDEENNKTVNSNKAEDREINKDGKQNKNKQEKNKKNNKKQENENKNNKASLSFLNISI